MALRLVLLLVCACGSTTTKTVPTARFYGYSLVASTSLDRSPPPLAPAKALDAVTRHKRVAFVPPDTCLDMRAADSSSTVDKRVLRMQCGVTMSELEREAEKAGFEVVTWQSLKGRSKPLDQAKEQRIELLFEVNELDVIEEHDRASEIEFRYVTGEGTGPLVPLQVTAEDNRACRAYHDQHAPPLSGMTVVLDLKMVQVTNGSVLWSYRHVENAKAEQRSPVVRFGVNASQQVVTRRPWWPWLVVAGGIGIAVGVKQPAIGGAIAAAGVLAALVLPKRSKPAGEPVYETVSSVLCRRPHLEDAPDESRAPREPDRSSSFRSETRVSAKDVVEERRRTLIKGAVQVFMRQLTSGAAR